MFDIIKRNKGKFAALISIAVIGEITLSTAGISLVGGQTLA